MLYCSAENRFFVLLGVTTVVAGPALASEDLMIETQVAFGVRAVQVRRETCTSFCNL